MSRLLWALVVVFALNVAMAQEDRAVPFAQQVQEAEGMIIANYRGQAENRFQGKKFYRGSFQLQQVAGIYNRHIIYKDNFKVSFWGMAEGRMAQLALRLGETYLLLLKKGPTGFELVHQDQSIYRLQNSLGEVYLVSEMFAQDKQNGSLTYSVAQNVMAKKWQSELAVAQQENASRPTNVRSIASEGGTSATSAASSSPGAVAALAVRGEHNAVGVAAQTKEDAELEEFLAKLWPVIILMLLSLAAKIIQNRQNKAWPAKNLR
ncbi:MAG: hypothetical protein J6Y94_01855 [Bacteriovoracaceae bacterium]|nr:hypothetical protein [Bacteriovoracaceae bacterium]